MQASCSAANLLGTIVRYDDGQIDDHLKDFMEFCATSLNLGRLTVREHRRYVKAFLSNYSPTREGVTGFLSNFNEQRATKANAVKALRRYFRDYLGKPEIIEGFRMPVVGASVIVMPSREQMVRFHDALETGKDRAMFLLLTTSGMRKMEVLSLQRCQIDLESRIVLPRSHLGETKRAWAGFFNPEAGDAIGSYLSSRSDSRPRLFPLWLPAFRRSLKAASEKAGVRITAKVLRFWFANEMARLGVPDRFIDAFQGRIPRSVLARHYTDYSLENLKQIYDKAGIKVLV